jgi:ribosomal protein L11 methyltransferase
MSTGSLVEVSLSGLDGETAQAVIELFDRWGQGGAVVEQEPGREAEASVKTYLIPEDDDSLRQIEIGLELLRRAANASPERPRLEPHIRFLAETDWAEAWKSSYDVLRIGRGLVIKPTWRDYSPLPGDLVIQLDPGMAFGSGLHPTTRLCLEALEDHLRPGDSVLDVGAGSGILAIAAARLGAARVLALDTDTLAVRIAAENVALNHVESVVQVQLGTLPISQSDGWMAGWLDGWMVIQSSNLILANILADTILELAPAFAAHLSAGGLLIAGGIIAEQAQAVIAGLSESGLSLLDRRQDSDWVTLSLISNL